jgi:hypothetical protein
MAEEPNALQRVLTELAEQDVDTKAAILALVCVRSSGSQARANRHNS